MEEAVESQLRKGGKEFMGRGGMEHYLLLFEFRPETLDHVPCFWKEETNVPSLTRNVSFHLCEFEHLELSKVLFRIFVLGS